MADAYISKGELSQLSQFKSFAQNWTTKGWNIQAFFFDQGKPFNMKTTGKSWMWGLSVVAKDIPEPQTKNPVCFCVRYNQNTMSTVIEIKELEEGK